MHINLNLSSPTQMLAYKIITTMACRSHCLHNSYYFAVGKEKAHSTRQGIFQPKTIIFLIFYENICCRYSLEAPRRGASNEYHNICFRGKIRKNILLIFPPIWSYENPYNQTHIIIQRNGPYGSCEYPILKTYLCLVRIYSAR